ASAAVELESLSPPLLGAALIGESMADMHDRGFVHGDAHTKNFIIQIENRAAFNVDVDSMGHVERPLTDRERAGDLGVLKASIATFEMWEAVEAGYRAASAADVSGVFRLL
ncbi:MAG: Lipopolysaccharide kinase (Kdo/WaaP) family, partial [Acidobacteriota bacterium]|nr:Lipopolysaccharide kinase (Kdo/WaaP) family [Acidobacteriota bacterium]